MKHKPVLSPEDSDAEDDIANGDAADEGVIDLGEDYEGDEEHLLIFWKAISSARKDCTTWGNQGKSGEKRRVHYLDYCWGVW